MIEVEAPSEFLCPLTLDVMYDPVMSKYGQSFERSEILQWLKAGHGVCPLSRRPLSLQDLVTNHALRTKIVEWRKQNGDEDVVVVSPRTNQYIYGFITLPTKDESTDRTVEDDEDDLYYLQLASAALMQRRQQQQPSQQAASQTSNGSERRPRRRASTGSLQQQPRQRTMIRPLRGLRRMFNGSRHS